MKFQKHELATVALMSIGPVMGWVHDGWNPEHIHGLAVDDCIGSSAHQEALPTIRLEWRNPFGETECLPTDHARIEGGYIHLMDGWTKSNLWTVPIRLIGFERWSVEMRMAKIHQVVDALNSGEGFLQRAFKEPIDGITFRRGYVGPIIQLPHQLEI